MNCHMQSIPLQPVVCNSPWGRRAPTATSLEYACASRREELQQTTATRQAVYTFTGLKAYFVASGSRQPLPPHPGSNRDGFQVPESRLACGRQGSFSRLTPACSRQASPRLRLGTFNGRPLVRVSETMEQPPVSRFLYRPLL